MRGTEKQAKWAESIRAGWTEKCEQTLASLVLPLAQPEAAGEVANIVANIKTIDEAAWWIDNRDFIKHIASPHGDMFVREAMVLVAKAAEYFGKKRRG